MSTKNIKLNCLNCNLEFERYKGEYNRQIKNGRDPNKFFCGLSCYSTYHNQHRSQVEQEKISKTLSKRSKENKYALKSRFTYYFKNIRTRYLKNTKWEVSNIDDEYLTNLWNLQNEKCALTNIPIFLNNFKTKLKLNSASLDRIDSSKGYIKGNVQFVAYGINIAKNSFSDIEFKEFLTEIKNN